MSALEVKGLSVELGGTTILSDVELSVEPGEWVGLIGPNGAGKTTLLRAILGSVEPVSGSIEILDREAASLSRIERARLTAAVPQRPTAPPGMRVIDYVILGRTPHIPYFGGETLGDVNAARSALSSLELEAFADRQVTELSGGEFQRVVLARALAQGAPLLLLDEPTSALDVGHQQQVLSLVDGMRRNADLTVVSALHDLTLAGQFCDRLVMVSEGRVVNQGAAVSVLTESAIREYYGASVRVLDDGHGGVVVIPLRETPLTSMEDPERGTMAVES